MSTGTLLQAAEAALAAMRQAGFDHAQVTASRVALDELNVVDNEPSLLRSTETFKLSLQGIVDQRMASTELAEITGPLVAARVQALFADARTAPQDAAQAVSAGQSCELVQGPQEGDRDALADAMAGLLAFRRSATPKVMVSEASASHTRSDWHTLTTGGSHLAGRVGWYALQALGAGRDGDKSSSFNYTGGNTHDLRSAPPQELFGLGAMLRDTERQIVTRPIGGKFTGDVVLTPQAVQSLLGWLLGQVGDAQLIAGSSIFREQVGQAIAAPALGVRSWFDAPGVAAFSPDAFVAPPVALVEQGVLRTLAPTLYGSRKTGLPHVPVAGGWQVDAGATPLPDLIGGVKRGALVGRLSMGTPAANGNFSAVIKNSFAIDGGELGSALTETMIAGNMAQLLKDITGISAERLEGPGTRLPWLRIGGLAFS